MPRRTERGYTLSEIMMAASLLLTIMVLVSAPIMLTTRSMATGQAHLDSQHQAREPVDRMLNELRNGFGISFGTLDANSCNTASYFDSSDHHHYQIVFQYDAAHQRITKDVLAWISGTRYDEQYSEVFATSIASISFQPMYEMEASPSVFSSYTLPAPDPTATGTFPPHTKNPLPAQTLVMVRVSTIATADSPSLDLSTSFYVRN